MKYRDQVFSILAGEKPEPMPFVPDITDWYVAQRSVPGEPHDFGPGEFIPDDAEIHNVPGTMPERYRDMTWLDMHREFDWGVHVHLNNWYRTSYSGDIVEKSKRDGNAKRFSLSTPKGDLTRTDLLAADGSWGRNEFYVKNLDDLETMRYVVEHTHFEQNFDRVDYVRDQLGDMGQADLPIFRSPFGKLVHEYMGFENVIYAMMDTPDALLDFMKTQEVKDLELIRITANAPEKIVIISDHADENLIAPPYWRDYCIPFYQKAIEIFHAGGKYVSTHLDGNFKGFFPYLKDSGFDLLDGCTPAPMFNYEVEELADALPDDMYCFLGVPASMFCTGLPTDDILAMADRIMTSLKGRAILNVGDILPPNGDIEQVIALGKHVANSQ